MTAEGDFANAVLGDWDRAMDSFFTAVHERMKKESLTAEFVQSALERGFDSIIADDWAEWYAEGEEDA